MNPFRKPIVHTVVQHEVAASGALAALIRGLSASINAVAVNLGDGLHAIALALATPSDNSTEVQKLIDKQAARLDRDATAINDALNRINQTKEK